MTPPSHPLSVVLLTARVPALPARVARDLFASTDPLEATRHLLNSTALFDSALLLASPSLDAALSDWRGGAKPKKRRAPLKALSYALRMATRATPFGLFAGVGTIHEGPSTTLRLAMRSRSRVVVAPDITWLHDLCLQLEKDSEARESLPVVANDLVLMRGNRVYVRHPDRIKRGEDPIDPAALQYESISLRWSDVLRAVTEIADEAKPLRDLVAQLTERLQMDKPTVVQLVDRLLKAGFLIFVRPIGRTALVQIAEAASTGVAGIAQDIIGLETVAQQMQSASVEKLDRSSLARCMAAFSSVHQYSRSPIQVDLIDSFEGSLGHQVIADVVELASLMRANAETRLLEGYRDRFLRRYEGDSRRVPLLELVDPEIGIGIPEDTSLPRADVGDSLDQIRLGLLARALRDRTLEVELSVTELESLYPNREQIPPLELGCEIGFQVVSRSIADLNEGRYCIRSVQGTNTDGPFKTIHRFAQAFGDDFVDVLRGTRSDKDIGELLPAELIFTPQSHHANLLQVPFEGAIIASRREGLPKRHIRIEPRDIVIGIEGKRFAAFSRKLKRRLLIRESYMLYVPYFAPPHMRLLSLIGSQDHLQPMPFRWGSLHTAPFAPRVRHGRLVLSIARWVVPRQELEASKNRLPQFIAAWRSQWNVPRWVYIVERDLKLLLDLESPVSCDLIRENIAPRNDGFPQDPMIFFEEMLPDFEHLWLDRNGEKYVHEFIAGLQGMRTYSPASTFRDFTPAQPTGPGSDWTFAKLYCGPNEIDNLLRVVVSPFVSSAKDLGVDGWFFLRYADPDTHIRLRLHSKGRGGDVMSALAARLMPLLENGTIRRYSFDTYEPEVDRYGGLDALKCAEELFYHDSRRVLELLAAAVPTWEQRITGSLTMLANFLLSWFREFNLAGWMQSHASLTRSIRGIHWPHVKLLRALLMDASPPQSDESATIAALAAIQRSGCLATDADALLDSLIHMHFNRIGVPASEEPRLYATAWHAWHSLEREGHRRVDVRWD